MMALASALAALGKLPWPVVAVAVAAAVAWRAADLAYDSGRTDCEAEIRAAVVTERSRQAAANRAALEQGTELVTALADENARLKIRLKEIADDARDLPDGDACGLGPDGLRLLDRLTGAPGPGGAASGPHPGL